MFVERGVAGALAASRGRHLVSGRSVEELRREVASRARSLPPGPSVDRVREVAVPGRHGPIPCRVYEPQGAVGATLAFHGGGWVSGGLDLLDATARHLASASGQAVVGVGYRLAPEWPFPAAFEDACDVLRHFDGPNDVWSSPRPLALFGESAGGNLAAAAALAAPALGVGHLAHQVLVYPVLDLAATGGSVARFGSDHILTGDDLATFAALYLGDAGTAPSDWRVSPLRATVDERTVPALLVSAGLDPVRDQAAAYAEKLSAAGVAVSHVTYEGVPHLFFGMRGATTSSALAQDQVASALRHALTAAAGRR